MSRIYAAFTSTGDRRLASGSSTTLRKRVGEYPDTVWYVYLYDIKANVDTLVILMEGDLSKLPTPTLVDHWRTTASGQVRKLELPKTT